MNLKDINELTNKILSESTYKKDDFLNRWPYKAPYLEEKHTPETKKVKNCGCGKNPCETYGDRAEPVAEAKKDKKLCESCNGKGCEHCNDTGYHMKEENISEIAPAVPAISGVIKMVGSKALKKGAMKVANNVTQNPSDDEMSEELNPKLKAIDAKNRAAVELRGRQAAAERNKRNSDADAYRSHKNEVMAKGGRPVDALDSWMRKKLGMEQVETISKLIESNQFSEEELLKIINSI
jgi:hypothetical protein